MARIPASEIPNAPAVGPAPAIAQYGKVPGAQFANQPTSFTPMKGTTTAADFNQYARDLQQAPLPGGFAEGQARIAGAAGQWASVAGDATKTGALAISKSLDTVGSVFTDLAQKANQTRDATDRFRYSNFENIAKEQFETQMMKEKVPVEQWSERWRTEGADRFLATAQNFGTTPRTRAEIEARANGFVAKQSSHYDFQVAQKSMKDDGEYLIATYNEAEKKGDAATMRDSANELVALGYENEAMQKQRLGQADRVQNQETIDFVKNRNPQEGLRQSTLALDGKATDEWKFLNEDAALARKTLVEMSAEVNRRQAETMTEMSNDIISRKVTLTDAQIMEKGRAAGLDEKQSLDLLKYNQTDVVWNDRAIADTRALVAKYDPLDDIDPKTKAPSMVKYKEAFDAIHRNVPKENRQIFLDDLNKAYREGTSGKLKDGRAKEHELWMSRLKTYRDENQLYDPKTGKPLPSGIEGEGERKKLNTAQIAAADKELLRIQDAMLEWEKANPEYGPGEAIDKLNELTSPHKEANAKDGASYREQQAKEAEVRRAQLVQDKASYKNIGGVPQQKMPQAPRPAVPPKEEWEKKATTTGPRTLRETPKFTAAWSNAAKTDQPQQTVTAYVPGMGGIEGGSGVAGRAGKAFTMEEYQKGTVPHVSVAMDANSAWQGKYLMSPSYPGVVFKVEDTGDAFKDKGESAVDVAFQDKSKATNYKETASFAPIDEATARGLSAESAPAFAATGPTTGKPAHVTASISKVVNKGAPNEMIQGTVAVAGKAYEYRSGGYGRGDLPPGEYIVTEHKYRRKTQGMVVGDVGFSFALSDKYDKRVGGTRTLLRIHPDGGTAGTAGCIGIVGGKDVQKKFRDDLTAQIRANGGKLRLVVG